MFASRLDEARKLVSKDIIPITPSKQNNEFTSDDKSSTRISYDSKKPCPSHSLELGSDYLVVSPKKSDIMEKLSEYLFDLFDANCMEDFHRIEEFETRALESFIDFNAKEFTHEQYQLHEEFNQLFETLIEKFLLKEGYNIQDFYTELVYYLDKIKQFNIDYNSSSKDPVEDNNHTNTLKDELYAKEVYGCLCNYMQFDIWAEYMKDMAKQHARFKTFRENLNAAVKKDLVGYITTTTTSNNNSSSVTNLDNKANLHRLNDCAK